MNDQRRCLKCEEVKDLNKFPPTSDKKGRRYECYSCVGKKERAKMKIDMLNALGWECTCCGEKNVYFLTLDHVQNDGSEYRDQYNCQQVLRLARKEGYPKDRYQVLCMNCNFAKGHYDICPHKQGITAEQSKQDLLDLYAGIGFEHVVKDTSNLPEARKVLAAKRLEQKADLITKNFSKEQLEQLMVMLQK